MDILLYYLIQYRYLFIFSTTLIEGELVVLTGGFLVQNGHLSFIPLVLTAASAAVIGDQLFYWIGRRERRGISHPRATRLLKLVGEHRLFKGEDFIRRHGGKSVFLIRFCYGFRYAGAMTAGLFGMGFPRFLGFNLLGSFTWASAMASLGYLFGESLRALSQRLQLAQIAVLIVGLALVFVYFRMRKRKKRNPKPDS